MTGTHSGRAFYASLLEALTEIVDSAKGYVRDHGAMVAMLSTQVGTAMGLSKAECSQLFFASVLSDMGMVGLAEGSWENPVPDLPTLGRGRGAARPGRAVRGPLRSGTSGAEDGTGIRSPEKPPRCASARPVV
jgi:hypothetical protein